MSGFRAPSVVYQLDFEDTPLDGLVMKMRSVSLGRLFELQDLAAKGDDDAAAGRQLIGELGGLIVSWNLEDDKGKPVPVSTDGLMTLDPRHLALIMQAYVAALAAVPKAWKNGSSSGAIFPEGSLPMDLSSPNHPS